MPTRSIMSDRRNRKYGVIGIFIHMLVLLAECLGIWFLTQRQVNAVDGRVVDLLEQLGYVDIQSLQVGRTLVLGILNFVVLGLSLFELLVFFHNPNARGASRRDRYKWYVWAILICLIGLLAILIASGIVLADFWIIFVQILGMAVSVFVSRLIAGANII